MFHHWGSFHVVVRGPLPGPHVVVSPRGNNHLTEVDFVPVPLLEPPDSLFLPDVVVPLLPHVVVVLASQCRPNVFHNLPNRFSVALSPVPLCERFGVFVDVLRCSRNSD